MASREGMQLLANMALIIHQVEPHERANVVQSIFATCGMLDGLDPLRNRGVVITASAGW